MEYFFSTIEHVKVWHAVIPLGLVVVFFFSIVQWLTNRDFEHVNVYVFLFTRHDYESSFDKVELELIAEGVPLKEVLRSNYVLFMKVLLLSLRSTAENPILKLGSSTYSILAPVRGKVLAECKEAVFARAAGLPFKETSYYMAALNDTISPNRRTKKIRVLLMQKRDVDNFQEYLDRPPKNPKNLQLATKFQLAYKADSQDFLDIDVTSTS